MSAKTLFFRVIPLIIILTALFSGCSRSGKTQENEKNINPEETVSKETADNEKQLTFAIVYPLLHPFFAETNRGAREAAEQLNINLVLIGPHTYSVEEQIRMMDKLIEEGVDGIGLGPFDPQRLNPVISKAVDAGIKVICFDTDAPESRRLSFISTDNFSQGVHLGKITADYLEGRGKVIVSQGVPTQLNLNERLRGVEQQLSQFPDIQILETRSGFGNHELTMESIETMIAKHPDFDALIGLDAQAGPSAVVVWRSRGMRQFLIVSEDMPDTIKGIRDSVVTATITQEQYQWGRLIVENLFRALSGEPLEERITTSTRKITIDNVDQYYPADR